jgi:hypothetical protein
MALWLDLGRGLLALIPVAAAGIGLFWLVAPRGRALHLAEVVGLIVLLGAGVTTVLWLIAGLLVPQAAHWLVGALCVALAGVVIADRRRQSPKLERSRLGSPLGVALAAGVAVQVAVVMALTVYRTTLGWDGLFNWEFKAHALCLNGGSMPLGGSIPEWAHPHYPPFVPLLEGWLYRWLGRCDQGAAKLIFPAFYGVAAGLLCAGAARLGVGGPARLLPALLLFFVPAVVVGEGSASSGYADFPLAVVYLAAVIYLVEHAQTGATAPLVIAGSLAALLPWVKQDGIVLVVCLTVVAALRAMRDRRVDPSLMVGVPGLIVFGAWAALLSVFETPPEAVFLPITPDTLGHNVPRLLDMIPWIAREMAHVTRWGVFWPVVILSALYLLVGRRRGVHELLIAAALLPIPAYASLYLFSGWPSFMAHISSSFPRLMLHGALVAMLIVGMAVVDACAPPATRVEAPRSGT